MQYLNSKEFNKFKKHELKKNSFWNIPKKKKSIQNTEKKLLSVDTNPQTAMNFLLYFFHSQSLTLTYGL